MKASGILAGLVPLVGCLTGSGGPGVAGSPGGCKGECGHSGVVNAGGGSGGSSSAGSSGIGSSSGGASSTGAASVASQGGSSSGTGSSGGSTGGFGDGVCQTPPLPDAGRCPDGSFSSAVYDYLTCAPLSGATVQALDANAVPVSGAVQAAADGTFILCAPPDSAFSVVITENGYPPTYLGEFAAGSHDSFVNQILPSLQDLIAITGLLPGGLNTNLGTLYFTIDQTHDCPDDSGWIASLSYADGGAIPDGGAQLAYESASGLPDPSLTATTSASGGFFYDIDLSTTNYFSLSAYKPDGGICVPASITVSYTGRSYVAAGGLTIYIVQVTL